MILTRLSIDQYLQIIFILSAGVIIGLTQLNLLPPFWIQAIFFAVLAMILGVPHGAYDYDIAKDAGLCPDVKTSVLFFIGYTALSGVALAIWYLYPLPSLIIFLGISAYHFGMDWSENGIMPLIIGASLLSLPSVFHADQVIDIFSLLVPMADAEWVVSTVLSPLGQMMVIFAIGHILYTLTRQQFLTGLELMGAYGSATFLHPISFLIVFFCLSHSPRHLYHAYRQIGFDRIAPFIWRAVPLTLASAVIFIAIYWLFQAGQLSDNLLRSILILLSVLTVPHMALISYAEDH